MPTPLQILASSARIVLDAGKDRQGKLPVLKTGQVISARVIRTDGKRRAQLMIQGRTVNAKLYAPLKSGDRLMMKVTQSGSRPVLKLVDAGDVATMGRPVADALKDAGGPRPFDRLGRLMTAVADLRSETKTGHPADRLTALLDRIAVKSDQAQPVFLKNLIRDSGFFREAGMAQAINKGAPAIEADLKSLLLDTAAALRINDPESADKYRQAGERIETIQLLNKQTADTLGRFWLPLPVLQDNTLQFGQLLIDLGGGRNSSRKSGDGLIKLSFLLHMSRLGDLRADVAVFDKALNGVFGVCDQATASHITGHLPTLIAQLAEKGFEVQDLQCKVLGRSSLSGMSLVDELVAADEGLLNLVI